MWTHSNGRRRYIQLQRGYNNIIIENLAQVHRMNFILECNVIQCHGFQNGQSEVEACLGTNRWTDVCILYC